MQDWYKKPILQSVKPLLVFFFILLLSFTVLSYNDPITYSMGDKRWCRLYGVCTLGSITVDSIITGNLSVIGEVFNVTMNLVTWNITDSFNVNGNFKAKNITGDLFGDGTDYYTISQLALDTNASTACDDDYYLDGNGLCIHFNNTVIDINKIIYYNITTIEAFVGTLKGTNESLGTFDGIGVNVSEANSAPGLDVRINFTGVTDFNQIILRYKTGLESDHLVHIQLYDFINSIWGDHDFYIETDNWDNPYLPIWESTVHIGTGDYSNQVWVRIYMEDKGKVTHIHQYDFIQLSFGTGTFSSIERDPISHHKDENIDAENYNLTIDFINKVKSNTTIESGNNRGILNMYIGG